MMFGKNNNHIILKNVINRWSHKLLGTHLGCGENNGQQTRNCHLLFYEYKKPTFWVNTKYVREWLEYQVYTWTYFCAKLTNCWHKKTTLVRGIIMWRMIVLFFSIPITVTWLNHTFFFVLCWNNSANITR